jgi:diketogulonate reductase-like aldo/keto reductase
MSDERRAMSDERSVILNTGAAMPRLGFGVFKVPPADVQQAVERALEAGYRLIDTAAMYGNEAGVGRAIAASGLPRAEVFVTTKLNNDAHGTDEALHAFDDSLAQLGLEQIDLYLIHWPLPRQDRYVETWRTLEHLAEDGRARAIGVSNFQPAHLRRLREETDVVPAVNQIELHPYLVQGELRSLHAVLGIVTEAWSPLARGGELLHEPVIVGLAQKYGRTPAQVVIRWHLQLGNVVIPKSVTPSRIVENADVFGFELATDDVEAITALDRGQRTGPDPDTFG